MSLCSIKFQDSNYLVIVYLTGSATLLREKYYSHVIMPLFIFGSRGIGGGVRENNAYCFLLRMANLLTFIYNGGI